MRPTRWPLRLLASEPGCTAAITTGEQFSGLLAAEMLIERLRDGDAPPRQLLIGGDLTVRESTGPAPEVSSARRRGRGSGRGAPRAVAR